MKSNLVTTKQAIQLARLGFNEECMYGVLYSPIGLTVVEKKSNINYQYSKAYTLYEVPTVDEAIDFLRRKHDVIIYNAMEPFVDPTDYSKIMFRYKVKWCNKRDGWNGRIAIGSSSLTANVNAAKRKAIWLAIKWLLEK